MAAFTSIRNNSASRRTFCLITTLTDPEFATAVELAATYAQRWRSNCPSTKSKSTKPGVIGCSDPAPRNW